MVELRLGGVYEIVEDESNLPLAEEDKTAISRAVYESLQEGVAFNQVWSRVCAALPDIANGRTPKQLCEAYNNGDHKVCTRKS